MISYSLLSIVRVVSIATILIVSSSAAEALASDINEANIDALSGEETELSEAPKILSTNIYLGPNQFARFPVIRHVVDFGILTEEKPTLKMDESEGFMAVADKILGLNEGTQVVFTVDMVHQIALRLQAMAGLNVTYGKTIPRATRGQYDVVYEYIHEDVGVEAGDLAIAIILRLFPNEHIRKHDSKTEAGFDAGETLLNFIEYAESQDFDPSTASLVEAAKARDIPYYRDDYGFIRLGFGKYQRTTRVSVTSETSHFGVKRAAHKEYVNQFLHDLGMPVPEQELVHNKTEALESTISIGFPVVVKPLDGNQGNGVSINLTSDNDVLEAFAFARSYSSTGDVIVEKYVEGYDHRLLVVNGKLVAAAKKVPGHVVGDGTSTIEELVYSVNADPRRGVGHRKTLTKLELDDVANRLLVKKGYSIDTILPAGEVLFLRWTSNLSTGGTAIDVTDDVHPDVRYIAEQAVLSLGLDVGGVDYVTNDIRFSLSEGQGMIIEINAAPGFRMHLDPSEGKPRDVAGPVIDMLFPPGAPSRIPVAAITGTNGKTTTTRMVSHILRIAGHSVGMTSTNGVYSNDLLRLKGDKAGYRGARMVLDDPMIDVAVLETARGGILDRGLGFDKSDVAACLNIAADHLGLGGINNLEALARIKRVVLESATQVAILNADDPHCLGMASSLDAKEISYLSTDPDNNVVKDHILSGGQAVVLERGMMGEMISIYDHGNHSLVTWTHEIPATQDGKVMFNVYNSMFASAIAYNMGTSLDDIRLGLATFQTSFDQTPGRMNFFREHPFDVVLDYAHNAHGLAALGDSLGKLAIRGRRIVALRVPGDRRDEDIKEYARVAASHFDRFVCRDDDDTRGRKPLETPRILRSALLEEGVQEEAITVVANETIAVNIAMTDATEGDLVVIVGKNLEASWSQIVQFRSNSSPQTHDCGA